MANLNYEQDLFLSEWLPLDTYQKKWQALKAAASVDDMVLSLKSEKDYEHFLSAIMEGIWTTETGKFFINISQSLGVSSFLSAEKKGDEFIRDNSGEIVFNLVDIDEAQLFTAEEIKELVPPEYQNPKFIISEVTAKKEWGNITYPAIKETPSEIVFSQTSEAVKEGGDDQTQLAIDIVDATIEAFN